MGLSMARRCHTNSTMPLDINPNPRNFKILHHEEINGNLLVLIKYNGCTNFEGEKVLVYKNLTYSMFKIRTEVDPHFDKTWNSPFARFIPTVEGYEAAQNFCEIV